MNRLLLAGVGLILACGAAVRAHFSFIIPNEGGATARLIMSETLEPDDDVDVGVLSKGKFVIRAADGHETPIVLTDGKKWLNLALPGIGTRVVTGEVDLGYTNHGGTPNVLIYHPKTIVGDAFDQSTLLGECTPVELVPVRAGIGADAGVKLRLLINGQAAGNKPVKVILPDGKQLDETTDAEGLTPVFRAGGRYGAWARYVVEQTGERDGKSYKQIRHYATLVFDNGSASATAGVTETTKPMIGVHPFAATLVRPIASFGAVANDGWLYVYGGHSAERHEYSTASVSGRLARLSLKDPNKWEQLAGGVPVQGMNLAAYGGKVIRVGGMEPRNGPGQPGDNWSVAEVASFDSASGVWTTLAALPEGRSSHDVVVVGHTLYVVGGWSMRGAAGTTKWPETMLTLDLSAAGAKWESVAQPFARRALIAGVVGDEIWVMGGFDADDEPSLDVDVYNTATKTWRKGPVIPGQAINGFAPGACVVDGCLYMSVGTGELFRLNADHSTWELFTRTSPRIVHRLVADGDKILVIGGAVEAKMTNLIEEVDIKEVSSAKAASVDTSADHAPTRN